MRRIISREGLAVVVLGLLLLGKTALNPRCAWSEDKVKRPAVLVLDPEEKKGSLTISGQSKLTVDKGGLQVNSTHQAAVQNQLGTLRVNEGGIRVVGGFSNLGGKVIATQVLKSHSEPVADPYSELRLPKSSEVVSEQKLFIQDKQEVTLQPGTYVGGISAVGKETKVTMEPGTYFITDGDFFTCGPEVKGTGVTLVMTGAKPGNFLIRDGTRAELSAPTEGGLKGFVVISKGQGQCVTFNDGKAAMKGVLYAPQAQVGVFFNSVVSVSQIVSRNLMLNTSATLSVTGVID